MLIVIAGDHICFREGEGDETGTRGEGGEHSNELDLVVLGCVCAHSSFVCASLPSGKTHVRHVCIKRRLQRGRWWWLQTMPLSWKAPRMSIVPHPGLSSHQAQGFLFITLPIITHTPTHVAAWVRLRCAVELLATRRQPGFPLFTSVCAPQQASIKYQ